MNELFSLAVAVFKLSANYSEPKMSHCRLDGTRSVREKQSVKVSRARMLGSKKCKAAVLPEEVESLDGEDECARGCAAAERSVESGGSGVDFPLQQMESGSAELSDGLDGPKGKLHWLLKRDRVLWHADKGNYFGEGVSERGEDLDLDALSFRTALESCACLATFEESMESVSLDIDHRTSAASFRRSIRVSAPQLCRDSVEKCLVQCRSRNGRSCPMDPLDGVVFHRFMVNSRGDLFDYDLQTAQERAASKPCSREEFPGASGFRKKRKNSACRPPALKVPVNVSAHGQEDTVQHWKGQAEALREECELLQMERELAVNRWKQGCQEMDQALQTVHTLRMAVDSLMGDKLRGNTKRRPSQLVNGERQAKLRQSKSGDLPRRVRQAEVLEGRPANNRRGRIKAPDPPACRLPVEEAQHFKSDNQLEKASEAQRRSVKFALKMDIANSIDKLMEVSGRGFAGDSGSICEMDAPAIEGRDGCESAEPDPQNTQPHEDGFLFRDSSRLCTSDQQPSTQEPRPLAVEQAECGFSDQERRAEERVMAAIRNIVKQFHQENEQWTQVQDILHHVSEDMRNLSESCTEWEERALRAETLSNSLQTEVSSSQSRAQTAEQKVSELESCLDSMRATATQHVEWESRATVAEQRVSELESTLLDLRATAHRMDEWKSRAEIAEQKVRDLESGMSHLRATVEQVKGRHAIEQSRLLEAGTRLRQTGGPRLASNESPKSRKTSVLQGELQSPRPVNIPSRLSPPSLDSSRYKCDAGTDRKVAPMGFSRHRRTAGLYKDLETVELSQYLSHAAGDNEGRECTAPGTEARVKTLDPSEWQKLDGSIDMGHSGSLKLRHPDNLVCTIKTSSSGSTSAASRVREMDGTVSEMGKERCPPRPTNSSKPAKRVDAVMSYSGPMRQGCDPYLMNGADADSPYKRLPDRGSKMPRSRRVSRERLRYLSSQRSERNNLKDRRFGGGSWDADEDRSEFASGESDSDSDSAFESAKEDYNGWTGNMVDDWPEAGNKEMSKVRRKYQLPTEQQVQQRVSPAGSENTDAAPWRHQLPGRKTVDGTSSKNAEIRPEDLKVKRHLSAEKVKTAIPTFQSLFPSKLRRKSAVKNTEQKGRNMGEDLAGDDRGLTSDFVDSGVPQKLQGHRDSSVQKNRVSFLNGIQKQFLVRNSPGHMKQVSSPQPTSDRSHENNTRPSSTQDMERKPWKDKKSESSFLDDIRRHLIGRSPLHPAKDRSSRAVSPFSGDQRMHSLLSSPVGSRPPLIEITGNGSEFLGSRAFYSG